MSEKEFIDETREEIEREERITKKYDKLVYDLYISAANGEYNIFPRGGYTKFIDDLRNLNNRLKEELEDNEIYGSLVASDSQTTGGVMSSYKEGEKLEDHAHHWLEIYTLIQQAGVKYDLVEVDDDDDDDDL